MEAHADGYECNCGVWEFLGGLYGLFWKLSLPFWPSKALNDKALKILAFYSKKGQCPNGSCQMDFAILLPKEGVLCSFMCMK